MPNEHTIAENLQRLVDAKTAIANAITAKGGTVAQGDGLEEFPTAIRNIKIGASYCRLTNSTGNTGNIYLVNIVGLTWLVGKTTNTTATNKFTYTIPSSFTPYRTSMDSSSGVGTFYKNIGGSVYKGTNMKTATITNNKLEVVLYNNVQPDTYYVSACLDVT